MKRLLMPTFSIAALLIGLSAAALAAQSAVKTAEPNVVVAVAPVYPVIALTMGSRGDVVIEVTIDAGGKVVSANVISGNEYLRNSAKNAAMNWQFGGVNEGDKKRVARLTFGYGFAEAGAPMRTQPEITTVFKPPYRVDLVIEPYIIH